MRRALRIVAAALAGSVGLALGVAALASDAGGRTSALVKLQVAPRGLGSVSSQPPGRNSDGEIVTDPCTRNQRQRLCEWFYESGERVTLTAIPDREGVTSSFSGWSTPDCPGTGPCAVTLDEELTTVVARFSPLALAVILSDRDAGGVSTDPPGQPCQREPHDPTPQACFEFPPGTNVRVTVTGSGFAEWNPGCEPRSSRTCTVIVNDEQTWIGARFEGDDPPQLPTTIKVRFRLKKGGSGDGRVTSSRLDCGGSCAASYDYGQSLALKATPDSGSVFDGWNGVCARTQTTCTFPVGPITSITARFARDMAPPTPPRGLVVKSATRTTLAVSWTAATDDAGVAGYRVYLDDAPAGETSETGFTFEELKCGRGYRVSVDAVDAAGNRSPKAMLLAKTRLCPFAARLAGVSIARSGSARAVVVKVRASRSTSARLTLVSQRRAVANGRFALRPGANVLRLRVPPRLAAGRYQLRIAIVNPEGGTRVFSRPVLLSKPR